MKPGTQDIHALLATTQAAPPQTAHIDEPQCIGCTKCIQACPVDAIVGANQQMHTILKSVCIGCGLCVDPCPVNCIELIPTDTPHHPTEHATTRFNDKQKRLLQAQQHKEAHYQEKRKLARTSDSAVAERLAKKHYILEAIQRKHEKSRHSDNL